MANQFSIKNINEALKNTSPEDVQEGVEQLNVMTGAAEQNIPTEDEMTEKEKRVEEAEKRGRKEGEKAIWGKKSYVPERVSSIDPSIESDQKSAEEIFGKEKRPYGTAAKAQEPKTPDNIPSSETQDEKQDMTLEEVRAEAKSIQEEAQSVAQRVAEKGKEESKSPLASMVEEVFGDVGIDREDVRKQAVAEIEKRLGYDISEQNKQLLNTQEQIKKTRQKIDDIEANKRAALDRNEDRQVDQSIIDAEAQEISEKYGRKRTRWSTQLSSQVVNAEMIKGNVERARKMVNNVVTQSVQQEQKEYSRMRDMMTMNPDWWRALPDEQRKRWKKITGEKKAEIEAKKQTRVEIWNAYIDNGMTPPPNWQTMSLNDLRDDLASKVSQQPAVGFTDKQKLVLEQAGLGNASRPMQLNYLKSQGFLGDTTTETGVELSDNDYVTLSDKGISRNEADLFAKSFIDNADSKSNVIDSLVNESGYSQQAAEKKVEDFIEWRGKQGEGAGGGWPTGWGSENQAGTGESGNQTQTPPTAGGDEGKDRTNWWSGAFGPVGIGIDWLMGK